MSGAACAKAKLDACEPPALMARFAGAMETYFYYVDHPEIEVSSGQVEAMTEFCKPVVAALLRATPKVEEMVRAIRDQQSE